jgi:hypothetical protein
LWSANVGLLIWLLDALKDESWARSAQGAPRTLLLIGPPSRFAA